MNGQLPGSRRSWMDTSYRPKAYSFMEKQIRQGRQVYVICPMVEESEGMDGENVLDYTLKLRNVFSPDIKIASLHGKMKAKEKNVIMEAFALKLRSLFSAQTDPLFPEVSGIPGWRSHTFRFLSVHLPFSSDGLPLFLFHKSQSCC